MLNDLERKLLRIMYNYSLMRSRWPEIGELEIKTGRSTPDIKLALTVLENQRYIKWEDKSSLERILILEEWEREAEQPVMIPTVKTDISYWTSY